MLIHDFERKNMWLDNKMEELAEYDKNLKKENDRVRDQTPDSSFSEKKLDHHQGKILTNL